jgi:hypothetical protein
MARNVGLHQAITEEIVRVVRFSAGCDGTHL